MDFVTIDFETAVGTKPRHICSVGVAIVKDLKIVESYHQLVQPPGNVIWKKLTYGVGDFSGHQITPEMTKNSPRFSEIWSWMLSIIGNNFLLAHNASFDMNVLTENLVHHNIEVPENKYGCTKIAKRYFMTPNARLSTIAERLGIVFTHHNAEQDALACAKIGIALFEMFPGMKPEKLFTVKKLGAKRLCKEIAQEILSVRPNDRLKNYEFVFIGQSFETDKTMMFDTVKLFGASISHIVTQKTRVLVLDKSDWQLFVNNGSSSLGSDVDKAIKLNYEQDVKIYGEEDFYSAMEQCANTYCLENV